MIIKRDFTYTPKGKTRTLHIYLPDDYYESDERYPVMYFFDGHNLYRDEDATYGKSWGLESFLDSWRKKMIIVGMECSHEGTERLDEYSPYTFRNPWMGDVFGIGHATMEWIVNDIKPVIDREYRTYSFREATGIAGSSMGGLMSVYAAARYNHVFSKAGCFSSAVGMCMEEMVRDIETSSIDPDTRVYLSWGTEEAGGMKPTVEEDYNTRTGTNNRIIAELFRDSNAIVSLYCQRGGHHCEADWEKQVPGCMEFLWF